MIGGVRALPAKPLPTVSCQSCRSIFFKKIKLCACVCVLCTNVANASEGVTCSVVDDTCKLFFFFFNEQIHHHYFSTNQKNVQVGGGFDQYQEVPMQQASQTQILPSLGAPSLSAAAIAQAAVAPGTIDLCITCETIDFQLSFFLLWCCFVNKYFKKVPRQRLALAIRRRRPRMPPTAKSKFVALLAVRQSFRSFFLKISLLV